MGEARRAPGATSNQWLPVLIGLAISVVQIRLVALAWRECDVSAATGVSITSLYLLGLPALTLLNWLLVALPAEVYRPERRLPVNRWVLAVATTVVLVVAESVVLAHYVATPTLPAGGSSAGNVPDWWPDRIPA